MQVPQATSGSFQVSKATRDPGVSRRSSIGQHVGVEFVFARSPSYS